MDDEEDNNNDEDTDDDDLNNAYHHSNVDTEDDVVWGMWVHRARHWPIDLRCLLGRLPRVGVESNKCDKDKVKYVFY